MIRLPTLPQSGRSLVSCYHGLFYVRLDCALHCTALHIIGLGGSGGQEAIKYLGTYACISVKHPSRYHVPRPLIYPMCLVFQTDLYPEPD
jgi:hypothetical protein